jgi:predicted esterase
MPLHHYELIAGAETFHTPLLMLHGSGGTEQDMVPLAAELSPKSMAVAVRGAVPWGMALPSFVGLKTDPSMKAVSPSRSACSERRS